MAKKNYNMAAKREKLKQQRIAYTRECKMSADYCEDQIAHMRPDEIAQLVNEYCLREIKKAQAFKACQ